MISKITLGALLLAMLLGIGVLQWTLTHPDDCSRFLAGDRAAPSSEFVVTGNRTIIVPCREWLLRQTDSVQIVCLLDFVLWVVFLMNATDDLRSHLRTRRQSMSRHVKSE